MHVVAELYSTKKKREVSSRSLLCRVATTVMGSLEAPLLPPVPAPAVEGCPGCAMEWRKENSNVRIPYKEFFFVGVTTLASGIYIHHPYICLYMVRLVVARVWEWFSFCPSRDNDERRHHIVGKMLEWIQ
jgi:hypothetical protein